MYKIKRSRAGLGLFATQRFKRGERIIEYKGERIRLAETRDNAKYLMMLDGDTVIDGKGRDNFARYINHSCNPNAAAYIDDGVHIYARRAIGPSDEITIHYGEDYWQTFIQPKGCKCEACIRPAGADKAERAAQS